MQIYQVIKAEDLSTITGGSAVGLLGSTLSGATGGVKLCAAGGPWAMAGCGIVGGALGLGFGAWTGV